MRSIPAFLAIATFAVVTPASAATFAVSAINNSVNGGSGTPLNTGLTFNPGDTLTVSSNTNDLWSAGPLPRYSDGNGLIADRYATAADDSGQAPGTLIGTNFGLFSTNGYAAPFGALVGEIGGVYQLLGANYNGTAWGTGTLNLYYWDSNNSDNSGQISFDINGAVPEPASWAMMLVGFGAMGTLMRRRRSAKVAVSYA